MLMNDIAQKLIKFRQSKNLNRSQMANDLGISHQNLANYEKGKNNPKIAFFNRFKEVYNFDLLNSNFMVANEHAEPYHIQRRKLKNTKSSEFAVYSNFTSLGNKVTIYDDKMQEEVIGTLPAKLFPNCNHGERAKGDSMYPLIQNQAYLLGRIVESAEGIVYGEKYIIRTKEGLDTCKYIHPTDKEGVLELKAYNKQIPNQKIKLKDIAFICRVHYIINPT